MRNHAILIELVILNEKTKTLKYQPENKKTDVDMINEN